jgi:IS1 family transposase
MKYYCILAIKKDNPKDIKGYVEHSFCMDWASDRVNLYSYHPSYAPYKGEPLRKLWHDLLESVKKYNYGCLPKKDYKGKTRYLRKCFMKNSEHGCGRTGNEYEWSWLKREIARLNRKSKMVEKGYEIMLFRVNSKHCPVSVDLSEREGMNRNRLEYDKFRYRNARFSVK